MLQHFVGTTFFAFGRPPLSYRSPQCTGATRARRSGLVGSAPIRLTVPHTHESAIFCWQQPYGRTTSRELERRRRAASSCGLGVLLVSLAVRVACAHAERCREHPRSGSSVRWPGTKCPDLWGSPQIWYPADFRHGFEIYRAIANFPAQKINFPASGSRDNYIIHTVAHRERSCLKEKGLK